MRWKSAVLFLAVSCAIAQHEHQHPPSQPQKPPDTAPPHEHHPPAVPQPEPHVHPPPGHEHHHAPGSGPHHTVQVDHRMHHGEMNTAGMYLMNQASGTSFNPQSGPMPMLSFSPGRWNLMWMGQAFLNATQQSGPRGGDKVFSTNWTMLAAQRNLGRGSVMLRGMLSLEPATITGQYYPQLFQTGETAHGRPIVDGQHPHELFMELGVQYARPLSENTIFSIYYAPVGDAPIGPVAFPHRLSAWELPQATLGHHWQDSTHIANQTLTAGLAYRFFRLEFGGFHGEEPDENRWNIDYGPIDSWASRLWIFPAREWSGQFSIGRLKEPEFFHDDDIVRSTASIHHTRARHAGNSWSSSFVWARNYKTIERYSTHSVLAETVVPFRRNNHFTSRFEWSQRDELFEYDHELAHEIEHRTGLRAFEVAAITFGYIRDFALFRHVQTGIGGNFTAYAIHDVLKPFYGNRPYGANVFVRIRLRGSE